MLTRARAASVAVAFLFGLAVSAPSAQAADRPVVCVEWNDAGECTLSVPVPIVPPGPGIPPVPGEPGKPGVKPPGGGPPVVQPITVNGQSCLPAGKTNPQPTTSDPVWQGHRDGVIYDCIVRAQVGRGLLIASYTINYWASAPPEAPPPPNPRDLAQNAVNAMQLQPITIGVVPEPKPGSIGLVGLPNYMWVREPTAATYGPITRTASAGGYTVTATARVERVVWDMGDGPSITCGKGTPYEPRFGKQKSPTCGHVYSRQGRYPVSAMSYWVIDWAGIGQAGTINLDLTQKTALTIGEAQVISQ